MMTNTAGESNPNYRHGLSIGGKRHPIYVSWDNMKRRCLNPNHEKYHRYGGRGITVCADWLILANFKEWAMLNGWEPGLTIDRIDNDGNYEPSNCRWTTKSKNSQKKRQTKLTYHDAFTIRCASLGGVSSSELAKQFNVSHGTIWFILNEMSWKEGYE